MTEATEPGAEPLITKYEAFCLAYVRNNGNGTQAAIEAGYAKGSAHVRASQLISDPKVSARIDNLRRSKFKALHMGADEALAEIAKLARSNMGEVLHITPDGDPYVDLAKASPDFLASVSEAVIEDFVDGREVDENGETIKRDVRRVKVKTHNKVAALTLIARTHGLLKDKVEISASDSFAETMARAHARVAQARGEGNADEG